MRIQAVQSHGKSLYIAGESAEFTGMEQKLQPVEG